ncbi:MAG: oxidoreductase [Bryobacterales bacterium]|nr:oxidoreductase [Bryobacterales bacterium]
MLARLIETRDLAAQVRHFVFEIPELEEFAFTPGQFVSCVAQVDGAPVTRAYSIAAPPSGNRFELCLNRVPEGMFSPYLFDLEPGHTIEVKGPVGTFVWRDPPSDAVLVATGTGIAPFRAMLQERVPADFGHRYTLLFGVRYESGILYREEFEAMQRQYPNFRFWPTLSRGTPDWPGRRGHVQEHLFEATGGRQDLRVYICGLKAMVDEVRAMLKEAGFDRRQIVYEKYD